MADGVETLREAQSPEELLELILDVSKRLTKINSDWWTRTHPNTRSGEFEGGFAFVDAEVEAAWHRDKAAIEYRDALRLQALRLCAEDPSLHPPPASTHNAEADISDRLARWCMEARARNTPEKQEDFAMDDEDLAAARKRAQTLHNGVGSLIDLEYRALVKEHLPVLRARLAKHVARFHEVMGQFRARRASAAGILDDVAGLFDDPDEVRRTIREIGSALDPLTNATADNVADLCEALPTDAELLEQFEADKARWDPIRLRLLGFIQQPAIERQRAMREACRWYGRTGGEGFREGPVKADEERGPKPQPADNAPAVGMGGMTWQDAMKGAEKHVKAHNGAFPSVKRLAEIVGCSRPTMDKAISHSTYLKARKAEAQSERSGRTVALSDAAIEEVSEKQHTELSELIAEQKADQAREERQAQVAEKRRS